MPTTEISAENLGPIAEAHFELSGHGVTVLSGPNGSGKTTLLNAVQAGAVGKGKLPLRDAQRRGKVNAFGATITLGKSCRHSGAFEVTHLEGRFSLAELVDPGFKSEESADQARIKAIVQLTGVEADPHKFRSHDAFADFDEVVKSESLETNDLVEMARRVKSDYEKRARELEGYAETEDTRAQGCDPPEELDLDAECNDEVLTEAYNHARDWVQELRRDRKEWDRAKVAKDDAEQRLRNADEAYTGPTAAEADAALSEAQRRVAEKQERMEELRKQLEKAETELDAAIDKATAAQVAMEAAHHYEESVASCREIIAAFDCRTNPSTETIEAAEAEETQARASQQQGQRIRDAIKKRAEAVDHRDKAAHWRHTAERYREAAKATDEVLSQTIKCDALRIESDGVSARLRTDTQRGPTNFHDLSEGERWKIAIDLGADNVGEDGLLVIPQDAWEGLDIDNRRLVHQHAIERSVYVLTAEATREDDASRELVASHFES